ncbi:hypothetical protein Q4Y15_001180 [Campylobacter fetus]|uniref:Clan AA aspartic protease n=5 Tax=Campylobacter fetus TaxID=196 RepID=A0A5L8LEQ3_CAMFE|nr:MULTISPECIES: hypothetical protein [Campylobacter]OCS22665.1 hypothetical protein CFVI97532_03605 [Campylobacter fetus subsp. venerealis cfvi97/532]OCS26907.1 hypothetical protein CFVB10_01635 [Campylobacter fetus subsp. venerealis cfvB10]OCS30041.1 hypothetical protein CFVCCUG33900_03185 [Campylobacter fetus subsp. venerealis LMG 6570 = CCUG 33900]OCS38642.1 hypothetical protein CFVI02298_09795 [Campylobacter fetus subsp. venerealis cfvi02/298]ABK82714.1 hypothetical protein CFF8240_1375 [
MASWIRKFLSTLYVSAVIKDNQCYTYARAIKNGKIIKNLEAVFDCTDGRVDIKFNEYLKKRESEYHSVYLSVLLNSPKQWAIPAVSKQDFSKFAIQYNSVDIVAVDNNWSIVVPKGEIAAFDSSLNRADADLIYSPFSILYESILRNMIKDKLILYIYNIEDSMTMMIFQNKEMRFSAYFDTRKDSSHLVDEKELSKEDTTDIDNVIEKEEDKLNELDGLDDLSSVINSSKKESFEDLQSSEINDINRNLEDSVRDIGRETLLLNNIRLAIMEFYKNEAYRSDFIEHIMIFDGLKLEKSFLSILESELLIEADIQEINIENDMNDIMIRELYV